MPRKVVDSIMRQRNQVIVKPLETRFLDREIRLQDMRAKALLDEAIKPIVMRQKE